MRHGTVTAYVDGGCRCAECRAANTVYCRERRAWRREQGIPDGDPRHGTANGYLNYGCRCAPCREAGRVDNAARRNADRDAADARRWYRRNSAIAAEHATPGTRRWTPEEDAVVLREDMSLLDKALHLRRGLSAVTSRRTILRKQNTNPKENRNV